MRERFVCAAASQREIAAGASEGVAVHLPGHALESVLRRRHGHRSMEITIQSLGIAPWECTGPRARASGIQSDPWPGSRWLGSYIARLTSRCSCHALQSLRLCAWTLHRMVIIFLARGSAACS